MPPHRPQPRPRHRVPARSSSVRPASSTTRGTQACRVPESRGSARLFRSTRIWRPSLTDEFADATYVEPITAEFVEGHQAERDAGHRSTRALATLGSPGRLNLALRPGFTGEYDIELISAIFRRAPSSAVRTDQMFMDIVASVGGESAFTRASTMDEGPRDRRRNSAIRSSRPSFTMGGLGSGMAHDEGRPGTDRRWGPGGLADGLTCSSRSRSSGGREYELELMRDHRDNVVVVCSIENVDPVGVHTGDSVTVAPAMTLTDREYQRMRDLSIAILREVGVDTGGCNIQFAQDPRDGRLVVIER